MIDTQAIRKKILDLALRGKLTEQLPEDGTAEELYQQIQQKNHSKPIKEKINSEKPFDIPTTWKWVHLNEIADTSLGKTLDKSKNTGELCPYLCSINVHWDGIKLDTVKEARFTEDEKTKYRLDPGDLLICEGGDVGRTAIWNQNTVMYYQNALHRVRFHCNINPWFYRDLFEYYKAIGLLDWFSAGMTIKHLVQSSLYSLWLPLPPLSEQKRIVDKVDSMIAILNTIDTLQSQYKDNLSTLKSKIIDAGIQGKLTEQLPEDGTAEDLYQQIQAEKAALEKAGKIKRSKPLPPIDEEEKPFDIPDNWKFYKFGDLARKITDGEHQTPRRVKEYQGYYLLSARNVRNGYIDLQDVDYVDAEEFARISPRCSPGKNDVLISCSGSIGRCAVVADNNMYCMVRSAAMLSPIKVDSKYIMFAVQSSYVQGQIQDKTKQTLQANLFQDAIKNLIVPLPPLAEQKRIVAKLEELLAVCGE